MPHSLENTEARERVLDGAERLFAERGYRSVTLRDIAKAVGIHHTTLYYHVPGGKDQLFTEVMERNFRRHEQGLSSAIAQAAPDLTAQLYATADWLLSQPPMDMVRMVYSDMPIIDREQAQYLSGVAYSSMIAPIEAALRAAFKRGAIGRHDFALVAGTILGIIESLYAIPEQTLTRTRQGMAREMLDLVLAGLRANRPGQPV